MGPAGSLRPARRSIDEDFRFGEAGGEIARSPSGAVIASALAEYRNFVAVSQTLPKRGVSLLDQVLEDAQDRMRKVGRGRKPLEPLKRLIQCLVWINAAATGRHLKRSVNSGTSTRPLNRFVPGIFPLKTGTQKRVAGVLLVGAS